MKYEHFISWWYPEIIGSKAVDIICNVLHLQTTFLFSKHCGGNPLEIHDLIVYMHTVNFQNNAQVQINAWFKLTPGTKHTVFCILKERLVQFNAWSDAI